VKYRHSLARPGYLLTHLNELADGPVEPDHDGMWAISAADVAILAPMGLDPVISRGTVLVQITGSSPVMTITAR
jgi:hypothetical protein